MERKVKVMEGLLSIRIKKMTMMTSLMMTTKEPSYLIMMINKVM
jgi:hypothetical protein